MRHLTILKNTKSILRFREIPIMNEQSFIISGRLPTLNEYINANRTPLKKPRKGTMGYLMKKETDNMCALFIKQAKLEYCNNPQFIEFQWHYNTKHDFDNIAFAKKFILDALQDCGVLKNDNQKCVLGFSDTFTKDIKSFVRVTLKECENES